MIVDGHPITDADRMRMLLRIETEVQLALETPVEAAPVEPVDPYKEKRRAAIAWLGKRYLLHPANAIKRTAA